MMPLEEGHQNGANSKLQNHNSFVKRYCKKLAMPYLLLMATLVCRVLVRSLAAGSVTGEVLLLPVLAINWL